MAGSSRVCRHLSHGHRGVAALEFAFTAPIMVILVLATIELTNAVRIQAKVSTAAGQLAETIAAQPAVIEGSPAAQGDETGYLNDMCAGAALDILPYYTSPFSAAIASVTNRSNGGAVSTSLDWESDRSCATAATHAGSSVMIGLANAPRSLLTSDGAPGSSGSSTLVAGYSAIIVQVQYKYTNVLPDFLKKTIVFTAIAVARPRSNSTVTCTTTPFGSSNPAACPQNP